MNKKAIKILIPIICILLVIALPVVWLISCAMGRSDDVVEIESDGFFEYIIVDEYDRVPTKDNKEVIAIVGFSGLAYEQEVIDIPREIDGITVRYIGYMDKGFLSGSNNSHYVYCSENLKKIYIHDNIEKIENLEGENISVMVCSKNDRFNIYRSGFFGNIYFYQSMIDKSYNTSNLFPANIVFINNYSDEVNSGYYRLDNIEAGEKIPVPPSPERNGYKFIGWYTDPECLNIWDFDVSPDIEVDTEFRLYASWQVL